MTTKQIAEVAGVSVDTVQRKIKELYPDLVEKRKATNLPQTAAVAVMSDLRKVGFVQPTENLEVVTRADLADFGKSIVAEMMRQFLPMIQGQPHHQIPALPPPAELEPRDALRKIVDGYARAHGRDFQGSWSNLYSEYSYRYHRDIRRAAKNRNQAILDYADAENIVGELLALAYFLYGQKEAASA